MNPDEIKSLIVKVLIMVLTAVATALHMNSDATLTGQIPAVAADLADLGMLAYGIYIHWNLKKVPENSVVISPAVAAAAGIIPTNAARALIGAMFVVGALVALCAGSTFAHADSTDLINGFKAKGVKLPIPIGAPAAGSTTPPALTGNPITDLANLNKQIVTQISNQLEVIANLFAGDANDAMNAALSQPDIQDGNGYSCWKAASAFTTVYKAHPDALTGELMSDLEYQRLMFKSASNLCASQACQQVFGESIAQVAKFASAVPGGAVVGTQNPFTLACSFITTVAIVAPPAGATPVPTPFPTPSPTPSPVVSPVPNPTPSPSATPAQ